MAFLTALNTGQGFTAGDLNVKGNVAAIPAFQKVYFADGRTKSDEGFHKLDLINTRLVGTAIGTFTKGEVLTQDISEAKGVFDETVGSGETAWHLVFRTSSVEFDTENEITGAISTTTLTPTSVIAPPHWLPWIELEGKEGFPDGGSDIGCLCFGRIFLNDMWHPNQWKASRADPLYGPLDWLTGQEDELGVATPISSQNAQFGLVASPITCMIPYRDQFLIFGGIDTIDILRGDPAAGGQVSNIVMGIGIFGPKSWTWDDGGNLYFVDTTGFYRLPIGSGVENTPPINLTSSALPELFKEIKLNRRTDRVCISYDYDRNRITVVISLKDGTWQMGWIYDPITQGIFPISFPDNVLPSAIAYLNNSNTDLRCQYLGGYDGYIRVFNESVKNDDAGESEEAAISSYCLFGPIELSPTIEGNGEVNQILLTLSEDTDGINYEIYVGDAAEIVINNAKDGTSPLASGSFTSGGREYIINQSILSRFLVIKLYNNTVDSNWDFENFKMDIAIRS